ncbi:MAG: hypothetical protein BWY71_00868 [Planctomycetes bacterium ADurb.Bin412]|nr:MAG: hypothetical protein BWY71_00868 [Planctomycetes bacterium ADurb.Bin412]
MEPLLHPRRILQQPAPPVFRVNQQPDFIAQIQLLPAWRPHNPSHHIESHRLKIQHIAPRKIRQISGEQLVRHRAVVARVRTPQKNPPAVQPEIPPVHPEIPKSAAERLDIRPRRPLQPRGKLIQIRILQFPQPRIRHPQRTLPHRFPRLHLFLQPLADDRISRPRRCRRQFQPGLRLPGPAIADLHFYIDVPRFRPRLHKNILDIHLRHQQQFHRILDARIIKGMAAGNLPLHKMVHPFPA